MAESKKAKILVVDDEASIRELLHSVLTDDGHEVLTAGDGLEALPIAVAEQPDLILLDIMMPRLNGMETCQRLREQPTTRSIRVIILTAYDLRERLEESITSGADDFLGKPIDVTELRIRVRAMLKVKDMQDEVDRLEAYINSMKSLRQEAAH
jgi:DNA-binding response OmpR family regulator